MKFFGIYQDGETIQLVAIHKKCYKLLYFSTLPLNSPIIFPNKNFLHKKLFITGLDAKDVLIKKIQIETQKKPLVDKALSLQASLAFPFEDKPSVILPIVKRKEKNKTEILLFGTTKSKVQQAINLWESKKIFPSAMSAVPMALARFAKTYFSSYERGFLLHLGNEKTICVYIENHLPSFFHIFEIGKKQFLQELNPKDPFDLDLLDTEKDNAISRKWQHFKTQIIQSFSSINSSNKVSVLLTGDWENIQNAENFLFSDVSSSILSFLKPKVAQHDFQKLQKFAIPIGYIIDYVSHDQNSLQFFQQDCLPKKTLRSYATTIFSFLFLTLVLFIGSLVFQNKHFAQKSTEINEKLNALKHLDEKVMERSIFLDSDLPISEKIQSFHKILAEETKPFPYIPNHLKASEILDWLYGHPLIKEEISLVAFQYQLESFPTINEEKKPYLVKVSLKLKGEEELLEKLYDSIVNSSFVNTKRKLSKEISDNIAHITFYLKNR